jgi:hypothetical protein
MEFRKSHFSKIEWINELRGSFGEVGNDSSAMVV